MNKVIVLLILLSIVAFGCTGKTPETSTTPKDASIPKAPTTSTPSSDVELSKELSELEEDDLNLEELEDLDLEIDESLFE
ncbi:MAG: hypothetical protein QGF74_01300 [Candidatus Nanoarchaeia archaeon]|jgi:hypothetical protein|nr:hypothetical protein [Candidatus Nanoarchaeia archaeon]|tara:strand:- start:7515 stop:7754 length:240 start_codon:yes stop_codon:yes gene_type:complete